MMRQRVVALALTLVVAATPEAFAVCQVICASSSAAGDIASHDHSGAAENHSAAPVSDAFNIQANHDGCHRDQVSPVTAQTSERSFFLAIITAVVAILPPQPVVSIQRDATPANRSTSVPIQTPLRI
jgi:hypothetical protein